MLDATKSESISKCTILLGHLRGCFPTLKSSYLWHSAIAGIEKGVARASDSMNPRGYLSSSNHFSLRGDLDNMERRETTLTSIQDRNLQGLPDPTVSAHYTTMYLARVSIKG